MQLVYHARKRAAQRLIPDDVIEKVVADPDVTWPSTSNAGRPVTVFQRGAVRVIVSVDDESIVSAMWVHSLTGGSDPSSDVADRLLKELLA